MKGINGDLQTRREMKARLGWVFALGILMFVFGVLVLIEPFTVVVNITVFVGFILLIYGMFHTIYAFVMRKLGGVWFILQFLLGTLYMVVGDVLLINPFAGLVTLTLIAGILIFIDGVIQVINAFNIKPLHGWSWFLLSGLLGIILGILIWSNWPQSSEWIVGILVGVNLITNGLAICMSSSVMRSELDADVPPSESMLNEK